MTILQKPIYIGGAGRVYQDGVLLDGSHPQVKDALERANGVKLTNQQSAVEVIFDPIRVELENIEVPDPVPAPEPVPVPDPVPPPAPAPSVPVLFRFADIQMQDMFSASRPQFWDGSINGSRITVTRKAGGNGDFQSGWAFNPVAALPVPLESLADQMFWFRTRLTVLAPFGDGGTECNMKWFIFGGPGLPNPPGGTARMIFNLRHGLNHDPNDGHVTGGDLDLYTKLMMSDGVGGNRLSTLIPNFQQVNVQIGYRYGAQGRMVMLINSNDLNNPTAAVDVPNWAFPTVWGTGFFGNTDSHNSSTDRDATFQFDDSEFGVVFDPNWHQ